MSFSTALSGLNAANNNLSVTGNNIANANTVGFKSSVAEFADVYASSLSGNSSITPGSGVIVANDAQQFMQGTLQSTSNNLDMAISGSGFFTLSQSPTQTNNLVYSRDGEFSLDSNGYLVNNQGNALMAYKPNGTSIADGFSTGVLQPIQINTLTGAPIPSAKVNIAVNLNANNSLPAVQLAAQTQYVTPATTVSTDMITANNAQNAYNSALATANNNTSAPAVVAAQSTLTAANNQLTADQATLTTDQANTPSAIVTAQDAIVTNTTNYITAYNAALTAGGNPATDTTTQAAQATLNTSQVALGNLAEGSLFDPTNTNTYNSQTSITVYDSLGSPHILSTYFVKGPSTSTTTNWNVYHYMSEPATPTVLTPINAGSFGSSVSAPASSTVLPTPATLVFNSSGKLITPASGNFSLSPYTLVPSTGASPITIANMNFFGSTQVQATFSVNNQTQDGLPAGQLTGVSINDQGVISANFSNGGTTPLGQVALSNFANTNGLAKLGNTTWGPTASSGSATAGVAGSNNFGDIKSGSVEGSNVNLSSQLVNLIVAQQDYQANAKTITTENTIMDSILHI